MSLLAAIPGLSAHETAVPAAVPQSFDREQAMQVLRDGVSIIMSEYPPGAFDWLRKNRPDVMSFLKDDGKAVNQAFMSEDLAALTKVVEMSVKRHKRAFDIFASRPPAIETQGALL